MDINNNTNISNAIASSLSKLNLNTTRPQTQQKQQTQEMQEMAQVAFDIKEEDSKLMDSKNIKNPVDVEDIQKYANYMGENLTIEDINYGLMYGRSVIADYSV